MPTCTCACAWIFLCVEERQWNTHCFIPYRPLLHITMVLRLPQCNSRWISVFPKNPQSKCMTQIPKSTGFWNFPYVCSVTPWTKVLCVSVFSLVEVNFRCILLSDEQVGVMRSWSVSGVDGMYRPCRLKSVLLRKTHWNEICIPRLLEIGFIFCIKADKSTWHFVVCLE